MIVFNLIMYRMLSRSIPMELLDSVFVLEKWSLDLNKGMENVRTQISVLKSRYGEKLPQPLEPAPISGGKIEMFDINDFRIFVSQRKTTLGKFNHYRVYGLYKKRTEEDYRLFLGSFALDRYDPLSSGLRKGTSSHDGG
ncbi:hypothetical protein ACQY0O_007873 [Thecaphora frezii]